VFESRVLRRIFGLKREEVAGGWRRLRNEELHNLYGSPYIIRVTKSRRMRWVGHVDWIHLAQDTDPCRAVVNVVINRRVP